MAATSNQVKEFLLARQQHDPVASVDWSARRSQWVKAIKALFRFVQDDLLAGAISAGLVTTSTADKSIEEEFLGKYKAPELTIKMGGESVRLSPRGRNTIGAQGRVDLVGDLDTVTFLLDVEGSWNVVLSRVPQNVVPLDDKSFTAALKQVMR